MKFFNKISGIGLIAVLIMIAAPHKSKAQEDEGGYVSNQEFYDELDPYGTWVNDPTYGDVWIPDVEDGFRPYATQGHWVVTDYGNTWVSDYPWGWATFHYGRWKFDDYYGWEWIPGNEWAPAWVSWRSGGGYYGWAPLQPGISIDVSFGNNYNVPDDYWVCAPQAYIASPNIYNYYVPHTRVITIIHRTTIIHNTYVYNKRTYVTGPRITEIRRVTRNKNVRVYNITNVNRPNGGGRIVNNTVNIYRPTIKKSPDARPARVVDGAAYRKDNPNNGIANRRGGQATISRSNATRLKEVAKSDKPDNRVVKVNHDRPAPRPANGDNKRPDQPGAKPNPADNNNKRPERPGTKPANGDNTRPGQPARPNNGDNKRPDQPASTKPETGDNKRPTRTPRPATTNDKRPDQTGTRPTTAPATDQPTRQQQPNAEQKQAQQTVREQQAQQRQAQKQQLEQEKAQHQQEAQQRQQQHQQLEQQKQEQQAQKQQAAQQRQQEQAQKQQELQQRQQQRQQEAEQRQQAAQQRQQAAQQKQQEQQAAQAQRQQEAQQRQQAAQQRQQEAQQRQQAAQQRQQEAQQRRDQAKKPANQ